MAKQKYYAVRVGRKPGIYRSWGECNKQVHKYSGAKYKSFLTRAEAEAYLKQKEPEQFKYQKAGMNSLQAEKSENKSANSIDTVIENNNVHIPTKKKINTPILQTREIDILFEKHQLLGDLGFKFKKIKNIISDGDMKCLSDIQVYVNDIEGRIAELTRLLRR